MRIAIITSELATYAGTGGLGEAVASLSRGLVVLGHQVTVLLPFYRSVDRAKRSYDKRSEVIDVRLGAQTRRASLFEPKERAASDPRVLLIDLPEYFDRHALYGEPYADYGDNGERFAFFSKAALNALEVLAIWPEVVHAHDWPTGLVPVLMSLDPDRPPDRRSVFTVHNLSFQGLFGLELARSIGLPERLLVPSGLEFYHRLSFAKGGLLFADLLTTVSKTYARDILTEAHGMGLDGVLRDRRQDLFGILNGIDAEVWDPSADPRLPQRFDAADLIGKAACKEKAQAAMGLPLRSDAMLCVAVSRLTTQKGLDLLPDVSLAIDHRPIQIAIHGGGDPHLEAMMADLARVRPDRVAVRIGFDADLAHLLFAGADAVLVPSRFEPCGLAQLYGLRYGAVPIVRATGGLAETVIDVEHFPEEGNGFAFDGVGAPPIVQAILRAEALFRAPEAWRAVVERAMRVDHSATGAAGRYVEAYARALELPPRGWLHAPRNRG